MCVYTYIHIYIYRSLFGLVPVGTNDLVVPLDTSLDSFTHFLVYAGSSLAEQSTPLGHEIYDYDASVSSLAFRARKRLVTCRSPGCFGEDPLNLAWTCVGMHCVASAVGSWQRSYG